MKFGDDTAIIVTDIQNDFLPGGALAVPGGDEIVPLVNRMARRFRHVIITQDWHPSGHISFASHHSDKKPFDVIDLPYGPQVLWPDHCIMGTHGAALACGLDLPQAELIIRKGFHPQTDSYSAFIEADRATRTGLAGYLRERQITSVVCVGLATDFCVSWTALDARAAGFHATVVENACRAINANGSLDRARTAWREQGVAVADLDG